MVTIPKLIEPLQIALAIVFSTGKTVKALVIHSAPALIHSLST
jgi:hypothetical protein